MLHFIWILAVIWVFCVMCLFLSVATCRGWSVIVTFPGHTHSFALKMTKKHAQLPSMLWVIDMYWYKKPSESGSNLNSDTSDCSSLTELEVYDNNICWFMLIHEEFNACIQCAAVCLVDVYKELRAYKLHNSLPAWWLQIIMISHNITMKMYLNTLFVLFWLLCIPNQELWSRRDRQFT